MANNPEAAAWAVFGVLALLVGVVWIVYVVREDNRQDREAMRMLERHRAVMREGFEQRPYWGRLESTED